MEDGSQTDQDCEPEVESDVPRATLLFIRTIRTIKFGVTERRPEDALAFILTRPTVRVDLAKFEISVTLSLSCLITKGGFHVATVLTERLICGRAQFRTKDTCIRVTRVERKDL